MNFLTPLFILFIYTFTYCQTWQKTPISSNPEGKRFDDVFFLNNSIGWAANGSLATVYKTTDGGLTWTEQLNETTLGGNYYFRNIEFLNENIGFLGTLNNAFYTTTDGGTTWNAVTNIPTTPNAICGIDTVGKTTVYGCGAYFEPAFIIKSTDSGNTWEYIDMNLYATGLVEILFTSETIGYACGKSTTGGCILKTTDGGTTWNEIYNTGIPGEYVWKLQVLKQNPNVFFGAVTSVAPHPGKLIKSINNGKTWVSHNAPETDIQGVGFVTENRGWMGGHNTGFYETNDGGKTWTNLNFGANLNRIVVMSPTLAYAAGESIYKFTTETLSINSNKNVLPEKLHISLKNNPVKSYLTFTINYPSNDHILIEIYDNKGRFIKQLTRETINKKQQKHYAFNVENLASGNYFVNFHNDFYRQSLQFIKN